MAVRKAEKGAAEKREEAAIKATDILCTVGPASSRTHTLRDMRKSGMTMVRINMAHASPADLEYFVDRIRKITNRISVLVDLPGPKIRIGSIAPMHLAPGMAVSLTTRPAPPIGRIPVDYPLLHEKLSPGDRLKVDDGMVGLLVTAVEENDIHCEVEYGTQLLANKGINAHKVDEGFPVITPHDLALIPQIAPSRPQFVAVSFVQGPENVTAVRGALDRAGAEAAQLIAKIETPEGVANLKPILDCEHTAGVLIGRGDLAYEGDRAELLLNSLRILLEAKKAGKMAIMATQMLHSMQESRVPTRAEIFDISLAVALGVDAVMTSGETAVGSFPIDAVRVMREVVTAAEEKRSELRKLLYGILAQG